MARPPRPKGVPSVMLLCEIAKLFHDRMRRESEKIGMQGSFRPILCHLSKTEGITQQALAQRTHLKAPSITVTLQKMEQAGLIIRQQNPDDLRQTLVFSTDRGEELDKKMRKLLSETEAILMEGVLESPALIEALTTMRNNILAEREHHERF